MFKSKYNEIVKYRKRKQGLLTFKNLALSSTIMLIIVSIGYSYWNTTLKIKGTITAIGDFSSGGTTTTDAYDPDSLKEGTYTYTTSPGKPTVTVENGVVKEYTFTDNTGYDTSSEGIDTGFIPFEGGKDFEIKIRAYYPDTNKSTNAILLDVRNREANSGNSMQVTYTDNKTPPRILINGKITDLSLVNQEIDLTITYKNGVLTVNHNGTTFTKTVSISIANKTILLGYSLNTSGNVIRRANATIYEFSVKEI